MEENKLVKVVGCYLMQGDNIIDFWLNKYYENGESSEETFKTLAPLILEVLKSIKQGAVFSVEVYEA